MVSPFERVAQEEDLAAKLPADNWRQRRIDDIHAHEPTITAVGAVIDRLGRLVLDGRISTNISREVQPVRINSTDPSNEIAQATIAISPTGVPRRWFGHGIFTPDAALSVAVHLKDRYDYPGQGRRPRPLGQVSLAVHARSWGRITPEEVEAITAVNGADASYGDNGFNRYGTIVTVWREAGQTLDQEEVETLLAPLAGHILHYFDIMSLKDPAARQPTGNFSNRTVTRNSVHQMSDANTATTVLARTLAIE